MGGLGAIQFSTIQRIRLVSGCILFSFVATHLLNHTLGNISLDAMEAGRRVFLAAWRNPVGTVLLYGSFIVHAALVLYSVYRRRRLRMSRLEVVQIVFGFAIPLFMASHVAGNRAAHELYGVEDSYAYVVLSTWVWNWQEGLLIALGVLVVWTHGCLGIHFWLRLKPFYPRVANWLFAGALLLPAAALAGYASVAREAALLAQDPTWLQPRIDAMNLPDRAAVAVVYNIANGVRIGTVVLVVAVLMLRWIRILVERKGRFTVTYSDGRQVTVDIGHSILETSRAAGIPHASVCGGRGRCSTCRVRITEGAGSLPDASLEEIKVLKRIGAPDGVRLACQTRPTGDVSIVQLLPANAQARQGHARPSYMQGGEREIAIMFADLRSFTKFSESKLPYDVVFVVNQYFRTMGTAIEASGGRLDKFIGDGVMALFGVESGSAQGCRDALNAGRAMARGLAELNDHLKNDLAEPLRMGIGIHVGSAIVGEMGYRDATSVTAIGDAVNTASRLEAMNKEFASQMIVSEQVAKLAEVDLGAWPQHEIELRGRVEKMRVYVIEDAGLLEDLPPMAQRRKRRRRLAVGVEASE